MINKLKCFFGFHDKVTNPLTIWPDYIFCKRKGCGWIGRELLTITTPADMELDEHLREVRKV